MDSTYICISEKNLCAQTLDTRRNCLYLTALILANGEKMVNDFDSQLILSMDGDIKKEFDKFYRSNTFKTRILDRLFRREQEIVELVECDRIISHARSVKDGKFTAMRLNNV